MVYNILNEIAEKEKDSLESNWLKFVRLSQSQSAFGVIFAVGERLFFFFPYYLTISYICIERSYICIYREREREERNFLPVASSCLSHNSDIMICYYSFIKLACGVFLVRRNALIIFPKLVGFV